MAMVDLALYSNGRPITIKEMGQRQSIATNYLEQIMLKLKNSGLLNAIKGPGGGYLLAKDMNEINVAEIVLAMNKEFRLTRCEKGSEHNACVVGQSKCLTHNLWDGLSRVIIEYLRNKTLADLVK